MQDIQKKNTLTDEQLADKAEILLDKLITTYGRSFEMQIPARPNHDIDLVFAELIRRFRRSST